MRFKRSGFTIVELLIVIVVIAILAAISVVAYNGVQKRAKYSAISAALQTYEKGFRLYKAQHGEYPHTAGYQLSCLGKPSDYPADPPEYSAGQCGFVYSTFDTKDDVDATLNASLKEFMSEIPNIPMTEVTYDNGSMTRGVYYEGNEKYYYFEYGLPKGEKCPYGRDAWSSDEVLCVVLVNDY